MNSSFNARRLSVALITISFVFFQNCSRVGFDAPENHLQSLETPEDGIEVFEAASSGVTDVLDDSGTLILSGSLGYTPAMADASDSSNQSILSSGFNSILTSLSIK